MKKAAAVLAAVVLVVAVASLAFASEMKKGTIKSVDAKAGTITFCPEGSSADMTLKADKGVDLGKVKENSKAEIVMDKDTVKEIKAEARRAPVGC